MNRLLLSFSLVLVLLLSLFVSISTGHAVNVGFTATSIDPRTVPVGSLGGKFKATYNILNNEAFHVSAYLGLRIRPSDCASCIYFDAINDLGSRVSISPGFSTHERFFEIRPGAEPFPTNMRTGSYDVEWSIWEGPQNGPDSIRLDDAEWESNFMNIEWISLPSFELVPSTVLPGSSLTAVYTINNQGVNGSLSTIQDVSLWLDLAIRPSGTSEVISNPIRDEKVVAHVGSANFSRTFQVPDSASSGWYDVAWAVWNGKPGRDAVSTKIITSNPMWQPQKLFVQSIVLAFVITPASPTVQSISPELNPPVSNLPSLSDESMGTPNPANEISKQPTISATPTIESSSVVVLDLPPYADIIPDLEDIVPNLDRPIVYGILLAVAFVFFGSVLAVVLYFRSKQRRLIED